MRVFIAIASLALAVAVSASPLDVSAEDLPVIIGYQQGHYCPAQRFIDDCNMCVCATDGRHAACTMKACPPRSHPRSDEQLPVVFGYKQGDKCPAKYFMDDCNYCQCLDDGMSAGCTRMGCSRSNRKAEEIPHIVGYKQGDKCPAKYFMDDCNYCHCLADGMSAGCTRMSCSRSARKAEEIPHIDNFDQVRKCPPHQVFYNKCNRCICRGDGTSAICNLMGCRN